jgi:hypothetical protein
MLDIYRKAEHVHVWLGSCGKKTGFALSFLSAAKKNIESHVTNCSHCLERLLEGIEDVFRRSWFRRTWVKQEIYAAKQIVTHCGYHAFTGEFVQVWMANLQSLIEKKASLLERQTRNFHTSAAATESDVGLRADHISIIKEALKRLRSFRRANPGELVARNVDEGRNVFLEDHFYHYSDIINVMRRCSGSECSNLRDHVYALLGMTDLKHHTGDAVQGDENTLIVDYSKSVAQIFEELTRYIIRRDRSLAVLCMNAPYGPDPSEPHLAILPSWVPDLRFLTFGRSWLQHSKRKMNVHELYMPYPLHESGRPSGQYQGVEQLKRQSLYGDIPLNDAQSVWTSGDDPISITRSTRISLPDHQLRLVGRSIGSIVFGREPAVADVLRSSEDRFDWNIFHEGHLNRSGTSAELLQSASAFEVIEAQDSTLQSIYEAIINKLKSERDSGIRRLPGPEILIKIMRHRSAELLGVVSILVPFSARFMAKRIIVPPDDLVVAKCSYMDGLIAQIEELHEDVKARGSPMSRRYLGRDNFPASWLVPKGARSGDLILFATGSPLLLLVRPRPSSLTYEFVGQAMPCQMTREDAFPSLVLHRLKRILGASFRPIEEFVLE